MEHIQQFLERHTTDCVVNAFKEKNQSVEIVRTESRGEFLIMDGPEYDFMWCRGRLSVVMSCVWPFGGYVQVEWPGAELPPEKRLSRCYFDGHKSFGDALEHLQNKIWERIAED